MAPGPVGRCSCSTTKSAAAGPRSTLGSTRSAPARAELLASAASRGPATPLLDEQHLLVLGQRPEVVGDDLLQLVGRLSRLRHRRDLLVAGVDRQVHALQVDKLEK